MKFSNVISVAIVALLAAPVVTADLFSSMEVVQDSASRKHKAKKSIGKLMPSYTSVIIATEDEASNATTTGDAIAYMEDDLLFTYNAIQGESDLTGYGSHYAGKADGLAGVELQALFPELNSSLRGSAGRRSSYRYSNYVFFFSFGCRLCGDDDSLGANAETFDEWEEAFCDQLTGGNIPGMESVKGCRILQSDGNDVVFAKTESA